MPKVLYINAVIAIIFNSCNPNVKNKKEPENLITNKFYQVHQVIDGDTFEIVSDQGEISTIRIEGIDAPEKGMPFYRVSKNFLKELCIGKAVRLEINDTDCNGRLIAYSFLNDSTELGQEMIKAGLAWHFKKYNSDSVLAALEIKAREQRIGLWVDESPMPPWVYRELHRNGISTKDSLNLTENTR